jgi:siroheme decarboxylase
VNTHPQVAHNYERAHRLNMWFVLAALSRAEIDGAIEEIEAETGYPVLDLPREEEYFVGLRLTA